MSPQKVRSQMNRITATRVHRSISTRCRIEEHARRASRNLKSKAIGHFEDNKDNCKRNLGTSDLFVLYWHL